MCVSCGRDGYAGACTITHTNMLYKYVYIHTKAEEACHADFLILESGVYDKKESAKSHVIKGMSRCRELTTFQM